jgi:hypothetical protein
MFFSAPVDRAYFLAKETITRSTPTKKWSCFLLKRPIQFQKFSDHGPCIGYYVRYSSRDQTVHFANVTSLRVEGKQAHILCKPKTLPTKELIQRATKYCRCEIIFTVWTEYAALSATAPTPLIPLPFTSNGRGTLRFTPTTLIDSLLGILFWLVSDRHWL